NLTLKTNINNFTNNSLIKVYGDASFLNIDGKEDSKVCVFGTLKSIGKYSPVKVFIKNRSTGVDVPVTDPEIFNRECPSEVKDIEFEWEPSTDVEYQYNYN
ncbi:MAG TPA: hypothetical protein VEV44_04350, partial [Pseudoneobacillus sp.]|nr:hypothetical protein [Pseudoneobacillus sp.]